MFSEGIRRALGPVLRTVANTAVEKTVAPPLQPAAKAVANFAVSSFERGSSPRVVLNPPPVVVQRPPVDLTPPNAQGDGTLGEGDWLNVNSTDGVYLRPGPSAESGQSILFGTGAKLKVIAPPDNGAAVQGEFVYVQDARGRQGWVRAAKTQEMSADEVTNYRAARNQSDAADKYQGIYVNQFDAETQVGGDGRNANCGPTATLMAFLNEGLDIPSIPGITHNGTAGADVQAVRYWGNRVSDPSSDGVTTTNGETQYSLTTENSQYTGFQDVKNAVTAARGSWAKVDANSESIKEAIESGMSVVISGNFVEAPAQGSENADPVVKSDTWAQGGGAQEHLVAVVGVTPEGNFIVCDPAAEVRTPLEVTPGELDAFMRGNAGAIGIYDPTPGPRSGA
ncbi:C39 family peptidase [Corallococcus exiguus]|uniref:C39 family peptidase n=1 Tax=Corallococcus exiguus TaxID=83462 RepID=UPI001A8E2CC5|nr:C39 family peptidase [Corallococcus exiguus]MBN8466742.1 C39 family peptidase [Corallococcus exiguus]